MKISQSMAFTVNLGNYQSAKIDIGIHEIDSEGDIEAQVAEAMETVDKTFKQVYDKVHQEISYIVRQENS